MLYGAYVRTRDIMVYTNSRENSTCGERSNTISRNSGDVFGVGWTGD
jgi:hypothetical protein